MLNVLRTLKNDHRFFNKDFKVEPVVEKEESSDDVSEIPMDVFEGVELQGNRKKSKVNRNVLMSKKKRE